MLLVRTPDLLTNAPAADSWQARSGPVKQACLQADTPLCQSRGVDIAKPSQCNSRSRNPQISTCVVGSANPENVRNWAAWAAEPIDETLLADVERILQPIMNEGHIEGRPENN